MFSEQSFASQPFDGQRGTAYADRSKRAIFYECAKKRNDAVLKILDHVVLSRLDTQLCPLLDALKNGKSQGENKTKDTAPIAPRSKIH